jgi:hypothetical protein
MAASHEDTSSFVGRLVWGPKRHIPRAADTQHTPPSETSSWSPPWPARPRPVPPALSGPTPEGRRTVPAGPVGPLRGQSHQGRDAPRRTVGRTYGCELGLRHCLWKRVMPLRLLGVSRRPVNNRSFPLPRSSKPTTRRSRRVTVASRATTSRVTGPGAARSSTESSPGSETTPGSPPR